MCPSAIQTAEKSLLEVGVWNNLSYRASRCVIYIMIKIGNPHHFQLFIME